MNLRSARLYSTHRLVSHSHRTFPRKYIWSVYGFIDAILFGLQVHGRDFAICAACERVHVVQLLDLAFFDFQSVSNNNLWTVCELVLMERRAGM